MDAEHLLGTLIRGALGGRGKRSLRAQRYLTGGRSSFLNASTLLAVAGVAWGVYEAATQKQAAASPGPPTPAPPAPPASPPAAVPDEVQRLVRLTISAARADGDLSLEERGRILGHAREAGAEELVVAELQTPRPLPEIVAGVTDPRLKSDMYTLAFAIVRADESVTGAERIYLARLAELLGLDAGTVSRLEAEAASRIDASAEG